MIYSFPKWLSHLRASQILLSICCGSLSRKLRFNDHSAQLKFRRPYIALNTCETTIYHADLHFVHQLLQWQRARNVGFRTRLPSRRSLKPDLTPQHASKFFEAVMARRMSYLAAKLGLPVAIANRSEGLYRFDFWRPLRIIRGEFRQRKKDMYSR